MHGIIREVEDVFLQRCQWTCRLLGMETFSASRCHILLSGHQLVSMQHTDGHSGSSVTFGSQPRGHDFEAKKKKKKIQPVTAPWLFCFSSPSQILKIPNFLLNPFLIETLRVFSISCIESQPTQLLHIICWYGKNISCLSRLHTKSFCVVILFPFMFLISDGLWGPSKCLGLTYIPLFTLRVTKSAPAFFKTSANTFSQP